MQLYPANISKANIAAVVTLYNSTTTAWKNVITYSTQVSKTYVIDNSETPDQHLVNKLSTLPNIIYVKMHENKGIAAAMNRGAALAIQDGYDYLLTMDDDTQTPPDVIDAMLYFLNKFPEANKVGIVTAVHKPQRSLEPKQVPFAMSSGNLLNLSIYQKVGPFREDFFIDHVDHEYGLRLNSFGFVVIELPYLLLQHQLGELKNMGISSYIFVSHTPLRGYYLVRNAWILSKIYRNFKIEAYKMIFNQWMKVILFEDKKIDRLKYLYTGMIDAFQGHLGKYNSKVI